MGSGSGGLVSRPLPQSRARFWGAIHITEPVGDSMIACNSVGATEVALHVAREGAIKPDSYLSPGIQPSQASLLPQVRGTPKPVGASLLAKGPLNPIVICGLEYSLRKQACSHRSVKCIQTRGSEFIREGNGPVDENRAAGSHKKAGRLSGRLVRF